MTTFIVGEGRHFRAATRGDKNYSIDIVQGFIDTAASTVPSVVQDANINTITADYSDPYYDVSLRGDTVGVTLSAVGTAGTLSGKRVSRSSNGICKLYAHHPLLSQVTDLDMDRVNDNVYDELDSYVSSSLAHHLTDQLTTLIGTKTAGDRSLYTLRDHINVTYTRNSECWTNPLDLTGISPWNSLGGNTRAGTAITSRHVLLAAHYPLAIGNTIRFITAGNVAVTRTVANVATIATSGSDTQVALLDSDLPATIKPLKLLPADLYDYTPSIDTWPLPLLALDAEEKVITKETNPTRWLLAPTTIGGEYFNAAAEPFARMTEPIVPGDSGNPICMVVNGEAVLFSHWSSPTLGPLYHRLLTEIATALTTLGGGHSLSTVDLSSFTDYS